MSSRRNERDQVDIPRLRRRLLAWYARSGRDLPWRHHAKNPYAVWLSEMMLQQTQTGTVAPYFAAFLKKFPDVHALARADRQDVLSLWAGLGYYRRAHLLHEAARVVVNELAGTFPSTVDGLLELPGIGRYSAGAIASIAFDVSAPILDGNVKRVLSRVFAVRESHNEASTVARLWQLSTTVIPRKRCGDFNQALMDLGATVCKPKTATCNACPIATVCQAHALQLTQEIPSPRVRSKPKDLHLTAFIIKAGDFVLLHRRPDTGLWAGMWELPSAETNGSEAEQVGDAILPAGVRGSLKKSESVGIVKHQLTHRTVRFQVYRGHCKKHRLPASFRWANANDELPLPKAFQKILSI